MKWTKSRDDVIRTTVRAEWRLTRQDIVQILCAQALALDLAGKGDLPASRVLALVRDELSNHGMSTWPYWREHDYDGRAAGITAWAERQAAKMTAPADTTSGGI
jgi:hypothetical protein